MIEVRKSEFAGTMPDLGVSFVQASSDATRRLCEQGQSVAKTISEWNTEVSHFLSHRVAHNGETLGRMTKCQNLQEVFAIQAQWVREAADDYLKEMRKLMEANSRIMSGMPGSLGLVGSQLPKCQHRPYRSPPSRRLSRLMRARHLRRSHRPRFAWDPDTDPASAAFIAGKVYSEGRRLAVGIARILRVVTACATALAARLGDPIFWLRRDHHCGVLISRRPVALGYRALSIWEHWEKAAARVAGARQGKSAGRAGRVRRFDVSVWTYPMPINGTRTTMARSRAARHPEAQG